jgi:hypothetical protein
MQPLSVSQTRSVCGAALWQAKQGTPMLTTSPRPRLTTSVPLADADPR